MNNIQEGDQTWLDSEQAENRGCAKRGNGSDFSFSHLCLVQKGGSRGSLIACLSRRIFHHRDVTVVPLKKKGQ
jgi:hypothetical protein